MTSEEHPAPQCPEALYYPAADILHRCVARGPHDWHQMASGTEWRVPVDESTEVPF